MEKEIKKPQQERGVQKKELIVQTGFDLFCKQGYYHTNTAEIAKAAGVSTGIIYRYFKDKKAIFLEGLYHFTDLCDIQIKSILEQCNAFDDLESSLGNLVNYVAEAHYIRKSIHEEINSMVHSDQDVAAFYYDWEDTITQIVLDYLPRFDLEQEYSREKIHMIIHMVENYCHEIVFHKHNDMNYDSMKNLLIQSILYLLKI